MSILPLTLAEQRQLAALNGQLAMFRLAVETQEIAALAARRLIMELTRTIGEDLLRAAMPHYLPGVLWEELEAVIAQGRAAAAVVDAECVVVQPALPDGEPA